VVLDVPLDLDGARAALEPVLDGAPLGVACYNDDVAMAVLAAGSLLGLRAPDDLSVVGIDRTHIGQLWNPRLTTVDVDIRAFMDAAVADLAAQLGVDRPVPVSRGTQLVRLIEGASS
jgi:DNA-binding LacI/PurR family transcriptional regulator